MGTLTPTKIQPDSVGIFGGSFNPVHVGHTALAQAIQKTFRFNPLLIIPNRQSPLKGIPEVNAEQRLEMVNLAFGEIENTKVSTFELEQAGPSYAINTIEHVKTVYPEKPVFFILGTDAFYDLPQWHEFPRLLDECSFLVVTRAGIDHPDIEPQDTKLESCLTELKEERLIKEAVRFDPFSRVYRTRKNTQICVFEVNLPEVSSTEVRIRLQMGETITGLVPPGVERYLKTSGLYAKNSTQ